MALCIDLEFSVGILQSKDITTYLVNETHPTLTFEELCTGIGMVSTSDFFFKIYL